ncbi:helicase and polymerase-containing protein TEBICHI-like isoform X2 [Selaginella moellendorffii]|uniref:helicase and polymerase-containing protein TEBICHI-like isoform X2 n=1 Tax=Selaginella moellendorffii TaxID=88036 RepID=UPI000D1D0BFC|nr:helicase and polymerase-containing protein TEBICHI-like isoform X2 [Selaginella moellendorffii]|eukprot:XP_024540969.1 helicase and polymerase-containing protein TEBICHI-like isoform X2 [Selaginella moellendorffii]
MRWLVRPFCAFVLFKSSCLRNHCPTRYKQMAGRAGRAGIHTHGESVKLLSFMYSEICRMLVLQILIYKSEELPILKEGCQPLQSCLAEEKNGMMRARFGGTLLNSTQPFDDVVKSAQDSFLCHKRLIEWDQELQIYKITTLGKAAFGSSLSPEECSVVFEDLAKARESFVLASDLHLVYEVTPIHMELELDWGAYYQRFVELSYVDQAVGVTVMRMAHGAPMQGHKRSIAFLWLLYCPSFFRLHELGVYTKRAYEQLKL